MREKCFIRSIGPKRRVLLAYAKFIAVHTALSVDGYYVWFDSEMGLGYLL